MSREPPVTHVSGRLWEFQRQHTATLQRGHETGVASHSGISLEYATFAVDVTGRFLRRWDRLGIVPQHDSVSRWLDERAADLYLAAACEADVDNSWDRLLTQYVPRIAALAVRQSRTADGDEVVREILGGLVLARSGHSETALKTYEGAGSLFSFLSSVVLRELAGRARRRPVSDIKDDRKLVDSRHPDPLRAALDRELAGRFSSVFLGAWESLTPRERLALLFRYRDDRSQVDVARVLRVGEPRVSRLITGGIQKIRRVMESETMERPGSTTTNLWAAFKDALGSCLSAIRTDDERLHGGGASRDTDHSPT